MFGVARPVTLDRDEAHAHLLFEAFVPAARLAVQAGVPLDAVRDVLLEALLETAGRRHRDLGTLAVALQRTTRSVRMLLKRPDACRAARGTNVLHRAADALEEPKTQAELGAELPQFDGFDSARVALAALLRTGRAEPIAQRFGPTRYRRVGPSRPRRASGEAVGRLARLTDHLRATGAALLRTTDGEAAVHTGTVRTTADELARFSAEVEDFIQTRIIEMQARAGDRGVPCTAYLGRTPTVSQ